MGENLDYVMRKIGKDLEDNGRITGNDYRLELYEIFKPFIGMMALRNPEAKTYGCKVVIPKLFELEREKKEETGMPISFNETRLATSMFVDAFEEDSIGLMNYIMPWGVIEYERAWEVEF